MKNSNLKNALLGIVLAFIAAYLYIFLFIVVIERARGSFRLLAIFPLVALLYTSWVVIPLGVALGMLIPRIAYGKSRWMATLQGAALGGLSGLMAIFCVTSVYPIGLGETIIVLSVMVYSAVWVGAYAFYRVQGQSIYR